jgi:hypothetical protein
MLPTVYDSIANELVATTTIFGEIVFGETEHVYTANVPLLYAPTNYQKVLPQYPVTLRWTGQGYYDKFQLQIFSDSSYTDVVIDTTLNPSFYTIDNITNHTIYFWRVRSILGSEVSSWTPIWSFEVTDAFVNLTTPNGGEVWSIGSETVIRWETNIMDSVRLDLLYGQQIERVIDTTFGNPAYSWLIPTDLTTDTSYKIIITSLVDSSIIDTSDASFSIVPPSGLTIINTITPDDFALYQNFPNPFNPETNIEFNVKETGRVTLKVYDVQGRLVSTLIDRDMSAGQYQVGFRSRNLASGIYFYQIKMGDYKASRKMILSR